MNTRPAPTTDQEELDPPEPPALSARSLTPYPAMEAGSRQERGGSMGSELQQLVQERAPERQA